MSAVHFSAAAEVVEESDDVVNMVGQEFTNAYPLFSVA